MGGKVMSQKSSPAVIKRELIEALNADPIDYEVIVRTANLYRLPEDLRARCWCLLLHVDDANQEDNLTENTSHQALDIVTKDVERSMWSWGTCQHHPQQRTKYRAQLKSTINSLLTHHPELHYYQGYHDVATVLIMCLHKTNLVYACLERLSTSYLRDCMYTRLDAVIQHLSMLIPIIQCADPELARFLKASEVDPTFAISWILTWFSHNITDPVSIYRLFDFFLSSHPLQPLYFSAAMVLLARDEVLSKRCEMSSVHKCVVSLTKTMTLKDIKRTIDYSRDLIGKYPPKLIHSMSTNPLPETSMFMQFPYVWMDHTKEFLQLPEQNGFSVSSLPVSL